MPSGRRGARAAHVVGVLSAGLLSIAVAGCGSASLQAGKPQIDPRLGVAPSPRLVADGQSVPTGGGRYHVGEPYRIAGTWYEPREKPDYDRVGTASWYGAKFHGRQTANGEIFDKDALTAAHPTLPLPSHVRVTNLDNSRSVMVRVNDRGPFTGNRLIDVSRRTAELLDFKRDGTAPVRVQYVDRAPLEGNDQRYLMASYRGPDTRDPTVPGAGIMVAQAAPPPVAVAPELPRIDSAIVASGTAFDPYRALLAYGTGEPASIEPVAYGGPAPAAGPAMAMVLRGSHAPDLPDDRVASVFLALDGLAGGAVR